MYTNDFRKNPGRFKNVYTESLLKVVTSVWINAVGVVNGKYSWMIISSPDKLYGYILARNPEIFRSKFQGEALHQAAQMGFTGPANFSILTYQSDRCQYAPPSAAASHTKEL